MGWTRRLALSVTAAITLAFVIGASPASAAYENEPISLAWHPAWPTHASVTQGGVVYLGGGVHPDRQYPNVTAVGYVAAVDAATGSLLWQVPTDDDVRALALSPDGSTLYAGGRFTTIAGTTHRRVAAIDVATHSVDSSWRGSAPATVRDLVTRGNDVYVGGRITKSATGTINGGIKKLDATTGAEDTGFAFTTDNDVLGLALTGNQLILSGSFTQINGTARNELASIDLTTGTLSSWAPAKLCSACDQYWDVQTDGTKVYVATSGNSGGAFDLSTGRQLWRIHAPGDFQAVGLPGDGRVYFGGHFGIPVVSSVAPNTEVNARLVTAVFTATGLVDDAWTPWLYNAYPGVWTFAATSGKLWVGGDFTGEQVNGKNNHMPYVAAYPAATGGDTQPPTGTFTTTPTNASTGSTVHVVQQAIHDNVTPDNLIDRQVDWGDGSPTQHWTSGTTLAHVYRNAGTFTPQVVLTDQAGNSSGPISATAVTVTVSADHQPPSGTFTTEPATAWADIDAVTLMQTSLADNVTPANLIDRRVDWGDGTKVSWGSGTTLTHVYHSGGTFTPKVTLTDQAGNSASVNSSSVAVTADSFAPVVTITVPRHRHHVVSWRPVRGTAVDAGTGVTTVSVKAVEKRGRTWYAYHASSHSWVKASTRARALARSTTFHVHVNGKHRWHTKLAHLRQGRLVLQVWAKDQVKNRSVTVTHRVNLNRH
jgi:hypothetical protein